ncbi:MAG: ParB/RepB/Spo0J family partition protein [Microbacteriaceae bacterium]|nr:ParB/RepB/Spo0J family partition protein [Microbacteriaceae bacterium]
MAERKRGLGRGIGALIPTSAGDDRPVDVFFPDRAAEPGLTPAGVDDGGLLAVPGARLAAISPDDIVPNAVNPRKHFDDEALAELIESVREFGVLQPIVVRPRAGAAAGEPAYELVMGERRYRASRAVGLETIPAIVRETADEDMLRDALLENLHRADLNPIEEAEAYQQLLEDFGVTQEQLAGRIGRSRPQIANTIRLLRLPEPVRRRVAAGVLSAGHARAILAAGDEAAMLKLADKVVNEELNVRATEAAAAIASDASATPAKSKKPKAGSRQAILDDLAARIGDRLNTRVRISLGTSKGQILIDFATVADLNRIADELGVERG